MIIRTLNEKVVYDPDRELMKVCNVQTALKCSEQIKSDRHRSVDLSLLRFRE